MQVRCQSLLLHELSSFNLRAVSAKALLLRQHSANLNSDLQSSASRGNPCYCQKLGQSLFFKHTVRALSQFKMT